MRRGKKINCWQFKKCGHGPSGSGRCRAATHAASDGTNGGKNAGRICWTFEQAPCKLNDPSGHGPPKTDRLPERLPLLGRCVCALPEPALGSCIACRFFHKVRREEGKNFQLLRSGPSTSDAGKLYSCILHVESLTRIREHLLASFNLSRSIAEIVAQTRDMIGAQYCGVYLVRGEPPRLFLETKIPRSKPRIVLPLDESTAVGFAAQHCRVVNFNKLSNHEDVHRQAVPFSISLDERSGVRTKCFAAVPFKDSSGRVVGVLTAANSGKGFFSADDLWFMVRYGLELSFAIEKARFLEESISAVRLASIGETAAGLAHCIKGIAHALEISSYVVRKEIEKHATEDLCTAWKILEKNIARLAELSVDVLSYRSGQAGTMVRADLNRCARDAVRLLEPEAAARSIDFSATYGKNLSGCFINPSRIYRCLVNLIINAFDACTPQGGSVRVTTERTSPEKALICVMDTGCGMDERAKAIVFSLFKTSKKKKGIGIGLPTVYDVVKQHQGHIEIDSERGKGTAFRIYLKVV